VRAGLLFFTCLFYIASFTAIVLFYVYYAHAVSTLFPVYMCFNACFKVLVCLVTLSWYHDSDALWLKRKLWA